MSRWSIFWFCLSLFSPLIVIPHRCKAISKAIDLTLITARVQVISACISLLTEFQPLADTQLSRSNSEVW